jgi:hypothetical protein
MGNSDHPMFVFTFLRVMFEGSRTRLAVVGISGTLEILHIPDLVKLSQLTKVRQWRFNLLNSIHFSTLLTYDRFCG